MYFLLIIRRKNYYQMSQNQKQSQSDPKPTLGSGPKNYKWYLDLKKSSLTPPQWVFPVVWSILYTMIAVSGFLYLSKTGLTYTRGLLFYCLQIFLNIMWTPLFFWKKKITLAMVDLIALYISVAANIYYFHKYSETAAYMLIPYLCWLSISGYLNYYIIINNQQERENNKLIKIR